MKGKSKSVVQERPQSTLQHEKENVDQNGQPGVFGAAKSREMSVDSQSVMQQKLNIRDSEAASVSMATSYMPNHIDLQSDDDDEMMRHM